MQNLKPYNLGQTGKKEAIPFLIKYLKNGSIEQRKVAASAVKKLCLKFQEEAKIATPYLIENLAHENASVREYILKTIVDLPLPEDSKHLLTNIAEHDACLQNREIAKKILEKKIKTDPSGTIDITKDEPLNESFSVKRSSTKEGHLKLLLQKKISNGSIKNKPQLIEMIKELGLTINRDGHNYLGLRLPDKKQSFRIRHEFDGFDKNPSNELISIPALARKIGIGSHYIYKNFEKNGLIYRNEKKKWRLTKAGKDVGGGYKTAPKSSAKFVAWPNSLSESFMIERLCKTEKEQIVSSSNNFDNNEIEKVSGNFVSTTMLAKKIGIQKKLLFQYFQENGMIYKNENRWLRLTDVGKDMGGEYRASTKGNSTYIVWPTSLAKSDKLNDLWKNAKDKNVSSLNSSGNNDFDDASGDLISTSVLARKIGIQNKKLFSIFEKNGLIYRNAKKKWRLTESGKNMGGGYKTTPKGYAEYVVWPANMSKQSKLDHLLKTKKKQNISSPIFNPDSLSEYVHNIYQNSISQPFGGGEAYQEKCFELTAEQKLILDTPLSYAKTIKIIAFAGTGKTTTICEYAKKYRETRFLYLAYNKSVQVEATRKFPANVACRTAHSIAYRQLGHKFKNKLVNKIKAFDINRSLELNSYSDGGVIIKILNNYLNSVDNKILMKHFPKKEFLSISKLGKEKLVDMVQKYWEMMIDRNNNNSKMLHDGYLKLYQLSEPKLEYDSILVDEAQDLNPVIFDIVNRQKCSKIFIGDSHQQIYGFRGAIDAMEIIKPDDVFYLTNSFRFNSWIGRISTWLLNIFKQEKKQITGLSKSSSTSKYMTIISRTNAQAFAEAAKVVNKASIGFVGGSGKYRFGDILNVYWLYSDQSEKIKDPFYKNFISFEDFNRYVIESDEIESKTVIKVVEHYSHEIPAYLDEIYKAEVSETKAEIVLTTVHKSKGLEWDIVQISNDFKRTLCTLKSDVKPPNETMQEFIDRIKPDLEGNADEYFQFNLPWPVDEINELNLIYVAITRAKHKLKLNIDLEIFIKLVLKQEKMNFT